jgi:hypothetical protein
VALPPALDRWDVLKAHQLRFCVFKFNVPGRHPIPRTPERPNQNAQEEGHRNPAIHADGSMLHMPNTFLEIIISRVSKAGLKPRISATNS